MNVVTKSVEADIIPVESDVSNGEFEVILSTDALDRDNERLFADEWKTPLPTKIHFDSDHGMSVEKTVGSGEPTINDQGQMVVRGTYAGTPHAQMVRQLVKEGHITSTSVTFQTSKTQKDAKPQRELLNGTFCAVPANPEAVVLSSKSAKPAEDKPLSLIDILKKDAGQDASGNNPTVTHDTMVQAVHDAACHLGAECSNMAEADPGTADGGNKTVETSSTKDAGSPQESPDDSPAEVATKAAAPAPAEVPTQAAEKSADDAEVRAKGVVAEALAVAFVINQSVQED